MQPSVTYRLVDEESPLWHDDMHWLTDAYCQAIGEELTYSQTILARSVDLTKKQDVYQMMVGLNPRLDQTCLFIAMTADVRIGYFLGMIKPCLAEIPDRIGYINGVYVLPEWRGRGIGQSLLNEGMKWFRRQGLKGVELYAVNHNERAKKFWRKNGYQSVEEVMICSIK